MFDALALLRKRAREKHRRLEGHGIFSRMLADDLRLDEYGEFLGALARFYGGLEPRLLVRLDGHRYAPLYRHRMSLLGPDLHALGRGIPLPSISPPALPASDAGLLGIIYAIEGSAHGGQIIAAHCRKVLGAAAAPAMRYVSELSPETGGNWEKILQTLRCDLACEADADQAALGAACVFDGLVAAAT